MKIKNSIFYKSIAESYRHFAKPGFFGRTAVIDLVFFIAFSLTYTFFSLRIINLLNAINQIVSEMGGNISAGTVPSSETVAALASQKDAFMQDFRSLMFLVILLAIAVYLLWCVFQGTSWWLTHRHVGKKMTLFSYLGKFSMFSLIWFIAFVAIALAITELSGFLTIGAVELISTSTLMYILGIFFMIILYFSFISYTLLHHNIMEIFKGIFHVGVRKAYITVPLFLFAVLKTYILFRILMLLGLDLFYTVLLGIIIFIPMMIWSRILINLAAHRVHKMRG